MSRNAPSLLVSVRDFEELSDAVAGGSDIVDLKEPRRGPLAPASVDLWLQAASMWRRLDRSAATPPLSAALGEQAEARLLAARLPSEFAFAKVGPSRCDSVEKLVELWAEIRQALDPRIELVAVAYADWRSAESVEPEAVLQAAAEAGMQRFLIDTFAKDGRSTLDHLGVAGLTRLADAARHAGLWWALAGSIDAEDVRQLWRCGPLPDCVGVRGDVCQRDRKGRLCRQRLKGWTRMIASLRQA